MKRILCACALLSIAAFADTHPALKEAIDSKNYKQAENLIKNVGVKDIYCPETLAAKDADKIYGLSNLYFGMIVKSVYFERNSAIR